MKEHAKCLNYFIVHIIILKEVCDITGTTNAKEIWLNYFNNILFEKGVITEVERNKMAALIRKKCHTSKHVGNK